MQKEQPSWSLLSRHQSCIPTEGSETLDRTLIPSFLVDFFGFSKALRRAGYFDPAL